LKQLPSVCIAAPMIRTPGDDDPVVIITAPAYQGNTPVCPYCRHEISQDWPDVGVIVLQLDGGKPIMALVTFDVECGLSLYMPTSKPQIPDGEYPHSAEVLSFVASAKFWSEEE
jgi:hypothetical protein